MVDRGTRILWLTSFWLAHLLIFGGGVYMYQVKVGLLRQITQCKVQLR